MVFLGMLRKFHRGGKLRIGTANPADAIRRNRSRLSTLESLIPITERQLSRLSSGDPYYAVLKNKLDEYQLEFRERTGRDFQPPPQTT